MSLDHASCRVGHLDWFIGLSRGDADELRVSGNTLCNNIVTIRRPPGPPSSFGRRSLRPRRPAISCTIAMARLPPSRGPSPA